MSYNNSSQTKTFKIVKGGNFADEDLKWIRSLPYVSAVTMQKNLIRVRTEFEDEVTGIVASINNRYCNGSSPKLNPLFCVNIQPPAKHNKSKSAVFYDVGPFRTH
jgi:hypothetical protein